MSRTDDSDDLDPNVLTPTDFEAADEAIRVMAFEIPDPTGTRLKLAKLHYKLGDERFRFMYCLREPRNCCETVERECLTGLKSHEDFDEHIRLHIENDLTTDKLANYARELNCQLDAYSGLWEILTFAPIEQLGDEGEKDLTTSLSKPLSTLYQKSRLYKAEMIYISEFLAEIRVEKGLDAVELLGHTGTCAAELGWMFPRLLAEAWQKSRQSAKQQLGKPATTMAMQFFRRTFSDQFPPPRELSVLVHRELALARIVLRERAKATTADPKKRPPLLTVADWGDLGIAIDDKRHVWAITPAPSLGEQLSIRKAHRLPIRGRLIYLLELFASSADGTWTYRHDALRALGRLPAGSQVEVVRNVERKQLAADVRDELRSSGNFALDDLNKILSDLGHKFRIHVAGPKLEQGKAFYVDGDRVRCGFVVRPLIADESRHFRFGVKPV